jgi:hypothetical protein
MGKFCKLQAQGVNDANSATVRLMTPEDYAANFLLHGGCYWQSP